MKNIVVLGDVILDEYVYSSPLGLSAETPTIVGKYKRTESFAGGAALVVRHLLRLGCNVHLVTHDGGFDIMRRGGLEDMPTEEEMKRLKTSYISTQERRWKMNKKTRFFVDTYKYFQLDDLNEVKWEYKYKIEIENFISTMRNVLKDCDGLVICDNNHGAVNPLLLLDVILTDRNFPIYVDCQISQKHNKISQYLANYFFLNEREAMTVCPDIDLENPESAVHYLEELLEGDVILKRGTRGCASKSKVLKAEKVKVVDTCGAGDAFMAAFVASDHNLKFANKWAGSSVQLKGTRIPQRYPC